MRLIYWIKWSARRRIEMFRFENFADMLECITKATGNPEYGHIEMMWMEDQ